MQPISLDHLSRAIEKAIEAATLPVLVLLGIALLALAVSEYRDRRRGRLRSRGEPVRGSRQAGGRKAARPGRDLLGSHSA